MTTWQTASANMAKAARDLHKWADETVTILEAQPGLLGEDSALGDAARSAHEGARRWRSLIETGDFS